MMDGSGEVTFGARGDIPLKGLAAAQVVEQVIFLGQAYIREDEFHGPDRLAALQARDEIVEGCFTAGAVDTFVGFVRDTLIPRLRQELSEVAREARDLGDVVRPERYRASALNLRLSIHMMGNLAAHLEAGIREAALDELARLGTFAPSFRAACPGGR